MRKTKKTQKSGFRKRSTKIATNYIGGSIADNDYTLVGFTSVFSPVPIFLHRSLRLDQVTMDRVLGKGRAACLLLSKLYTLKNTRNLDFILFFRRCYFIDETIINSANGLPFTYDWELYAHNPAGEFSEQWLNENNGKRKNAIREIELKYPGLFTRMFVTPEEEQQALQNIQQQEELQKREELVEFEHIQQNALEEIKKSILKELQSTSNSVPATELTQEEKNKIYAEEFENTRRLIPYIREEMKNKKKKNKTRKYIDDL